MARTRLGLHGSAAAYAGFTAKEAAAIVSASPDVTVIVGAWAQTIIVPAFASEIDVAAFTSEVDVP